VSCITLMRLRKTEVRGLHAKPGRLVTRKMIYNVVSGKLIRKDQAVALVNGGKREIFSILA